MKNSEQRISILICLWSNVILLKISEDQSSQILYGLLSLMFFIFYILLNLEKNN